MKNTTIYNTFYKGGELITHHGKPLLFISHVNYVANYSALDVINNPCYNNKDFHGLHMEVKCLMDNLKSEMLKYINHKNHVLVLYAYEILRSYPIDWAKVPANLRESKELIFKEIESSRFFNI